MTTYYHLIILPLFNPDWFSQAFINYFGYPCYILTQCGIYFSTYLFIREVLTFLLKFYRTISIKYLQSNISILSSIAYGFFNIVTSETITDLNNTGKRKRIYTKHKITTIETDNILLSEKGTHNQMRRYSDSDSLSLSPKYTSKNSTLLSPKKTHPNNINDLKTPQISQDYDALIQNVITSPESPAKVFIKFNSS